MARCLASFQVFDSNDLLPIGAAVSQGLALALSNRLSYCQVGV